MTKLVLRFSSIALLVFASSQLNAQEDLSAVNNSTDQIVEALNDELTDELKKRLLDQGIEPSKEGVGKYLVQIVPNDEMKNKVIELIGLLSSLDYQIRETATNELKRMPVDSGTLAEYKNKYAKNPEALYRLRKVASFRSTDSRASTQLAVLQLVASAKLSGLFTKIQSAIPHLENDRSVQSAAMEALVITSTPDDVAAAKTFLTDRSNGLRSMGLRVLEKFDKPAAIEHALKVGDAVEGEFGLELARILVEAENEKSFPVLLQLIRDENRLIASRAYSALSNLTGLDFRFSVATAKERADLTDLKCKTFLAKNIKSVVYEWSISGKKIGHRLVADYDGDQIMELDGNNNVLWTLKKKVKPFACFAKPDGGRFVVLYRSGSILEIDREGKELRTLKGLSNSISGLCQHPNGNLLFASGQGNGAITEITLAGKRVRDIKVGGTPTGVEVLPNGNLIVACWGGKNVVEVDMKGKTIREFKVDQAPYHVAPMASGNLLVAFASQGVISEFTPEGKEIWSHKCAKNVYRAHEMDDGTISFADSVGLHRVTRDGEAIGKPFTKVGKTKYMFEF
jgi:hypothetical protein